MAASMRRLVILALRLLGPAVRAAADLRLALATQQRVGQLPQGIAVAAAAGAVPAGAAAAQHRVPKGAHGGRATPACASQRRGVRARARKDEAASGGAHPPLRSGRPAARRAPPLCSRDLPPLGVASSFHAPVHHRQQQQQQQQQRSRRRRHPLLFPRCRRASRAAACERRRQQQQQQQQQRC
eukprot:scaffold2285_cov380-Prasinococcus_capsulatus_cf.AAC.3